MLLEAEVVEEGLALDVEEEPDLEVVEDPELPPVVVAPELDPVVVLPPEPEEVGAALPAEPLTDWPTQLLEEPL